VAETSYHRFGFTKQSRQSVSVENASPQKRKLHLSDHFR